MDIRRLRHVVTVDESGSITRAAESLGLTQSAITKSIADTERELGYLLFDRLSQGTSATVAGRTFISRARRLVADMDQLVDDTHASRDARELLLRVVVCPASLEGPLSRGVRHFIVKNPECRVHMFGRTIEHGAQLLRQGDVDICIGASDALATVSDFVTHPLPNLMVTLFARGGHPLAHKSSLRREDLDEFPIIVPDMQGPHTQNLIAPLLEAKFQTRRFHIIESFALVADIVSSTDSIGIVSRSYTQSPAFLQRFCTLDFEFAPFMPLSAATRKAWPNPRPVDRFIGALTKNL